MALKMMTAEGASRFKQRSFLKVTSLIIKWPEKFKSINEASRLCYPACPALLQSCHEFTTSSSTTSVFGQKESLNIPKLNMPFVGSKPPCHCFLQPRFYGTENPHFISKFSEEINLEKLREQKKRDKLFKGTNMSVGQLVKQTIAEKCDMALANLTEEEKKKLQIIQLEHDFLYSEGNLIPSADKMTSENWLEAMNRPSKNQRLKYYVAVSRKNHLKESAKEAARKKKEQRMQERAMVTKTVYEHGRIFMRIYETQMRRVFLHNLSRSMRFGLPLVLDMDYAEHMRPQELRNTSKQLMDLYSCNRSDSQMPFHLHFTGCPDENPIYRHFQMLMHDDPHLLITVTEKSYLDLFDRKDLVYLSPNAGQVMKEFNPQTVYIIGAFNDKANPKQISYARSKKQKIRCQRLPLDEYLVWNLGSKDLTLNHMMLIMRSLKNNESWEEAFQAIPRRKVRDQLR